MIKILVVDDLFDNIITLKAVLYDCFDAIEVLTATSGEVALTMAAKQHPSVILLDILMPDMDGYEVCRRLKQDEITKDIPVVFVTALKETKQNRIKALKAGVDGFLTKPLDETELKAQINAMLKLKEANDIRLKEKAQLEALVRERTTVLEEELETRKKAEKELKRAEESWVVTFNAMNEGVLLVDKNKKIKNCNRAFEHILKQDKAALLGRSSFEVLHNTRHTDDIYCPFDIMLETRKREMTAFEFDARSYELSVDPVFNRANNIDGAVMILKDVSENLKAKEAIQKERQLLRTLIDNLPSAIYVKDKLGRKIIANTADLENIGAISEKDVIGRTDLEIFEKNIGERGYLDDMKVLNSTVPIIDREEQFKRKDGALRWMQTSKLPIIDHEGNVTGLVGIGHDITHQVELIRDLEIAKNKAEESDRLKSAFLANMSHEIRTPMNGILGFTDLLRDDDIPADKRKIYISNIQKSGFRMLNTVNDLIEISKIEVGEISVSQGQFDLHSTVKDICEFFRPEAEEKGLSLQCTIPHKNEPLLVKSDVSKLESIVTNLVKNAIKFSKDGLIEFSYEIKEGNFEFYCRDRGIGIPPDRLQAVFNRFEQADIEDRLALQGSGLGLAITQAYVEMLGGHIWVESEYKQGSTFYFTLPISIMEEGGIVEEHKTEEKTRKMNNKKKNILVVDDDETSLTFLEIMLGSIANELYLAKNGQEAVDLCKEKKPDIIFMDMKMPVMSGYEATQKIREFDTEVTIIAQTAYALTGDREKAIEVGCSDYISKPITQSKLMAFLE